MVHSTSGPLGRRTRNGPIADADEAEAAVAALTEAQRTAAEQRVAAEKLAAHARQLEESLAAEAENARHAAAARARAFHVQQAAEHARTIEAAAVEHAQACAANGERNAGDRAAAAGHKSACNAAQESAIAEVAMVEALLAQARQKLEHAEAVIVEAAERESRAICAEDAARVEESESAQLLSNRRAAREILEEELRAIREPLKGFEDEVPLLATNDPPTSASSGASNSARRRGGSVDGELLGAEPTRIGGFASWLKASGTFVGARLALVGVVALVLSLFWTAIVQRIEPNTVAATVQSGAGQKIVMNQGGFARTQRRLQMQQHVHSAHRSDDAVLIEAGVKRALRLWSRHLAEVKERQVGSSRSR